MANRVRILAPEAALPFLPSPKEFLKILGVPGGLGSIVRYQASENGLCVPDAKTLRSAENSHVSLKTAERIEEILLKGLPDSFKQELQDSEFTRWRDVEARNNGLAWSSIIKGLRHSVLPHTVRETRAENFVRNRVQQEWEMLQSALDIRDSYPVSAANEKLAELLVDFLSIHTNVCREQISAAIAAAGDRRMPFSLDKCFLIHSLDTGLKVDFYYRLLCAISLDLVERFARTDEVAVEQQKQWLVTEGCFGDISPELKGRELVFPFEMFLQSWRSRRGAEGHHLSWSDIARCLPDPYKLSAADSCASWDTVSERESDMIKNKKSRLREWRQGTRPQDEQLKVFVRRLTPEGWDDAFILLRARIAVLWGNFIQEERKVYERQGLQDRFSSVLPIIANYYSYWSECRAEAELIIAHEGRKSSKV